MECFVILFFGLKDSTMDLARVRGIDASMGDHLAVCLIVSHLHQGGDVGIVRLGFVCHATIIGTGSDDSRALVDSLPTGRAADQFVLLTLRGVIYIKLHLMFRHVDIIQDDTIINRFDTPTRRTWDFFD